MKFHETQYYYQGYSSHQTGLPYESSPHPIGSPARMEWCRGWRDAENDSSKRSALNETDNANQQFESLANKEDEGWFGEGLPPVGTECEWLASGDHDWMKVKVLAYHEDEVWLQPLNGAQSFTVGNPDDFRAIRTEAERRRDGFIHQLMTEWAFLGQDGEQAGELYDAIAAGKIPNIKLESNHE